MNNGGGDEQEGCVASLLGQAGEGKEAKGVVDGEGSGERRS